MRSSKKSPSITAPRRKKPPITPEAKENEMVSLAMDLAERQLIDGSASAQVITHFLKLGTEQARLERVKLEHENKLLEAKTEAMTAAKDLKKTYEDAMAAFRGYSGRDDTDDEY